MTSLSFLSEKFEWINRPMEEISHTAGDNTHEHHGEREGTGGRVEISDHVMSIRPAAFRDFWSKTFYSPTLIKSDACGYLYPIAATEEATIRVDFTYTPKSQFDQAGLLLFIDDEHWVKCGIEFCDGSPRLSVVVCNYYSDWSTQPWPSCSARLKIHKVNQGSSIVIEAAPMETTEYQFVRIAHISSESYRESGSLPNWRIGPFAACPSQQKGCEATFKDFSVGAREPPVHNPDLNSHSL